MRGRFALVSCRIEFDSMRSSASQQRGKETGRTRRVIGTIEIEGLFLKASCRYRRRMLA